MSRWKRWGHLSIYLVYFQIMVLKISKITHFLYTSLMTKKVTVWAKYLRASERSYLAYPKNAMNYWVLSCH